MTNKQFTTLFGGTWGLITAMLGIGWFQVDLISAAIINFVPITALVISQRFKG